MLDRKYPYIGEYRKVGSTAMFEMFGGLTVKFTGPGTGIVLKSPPGLSSYPVGSQRTDWVEGAFIQIGYLKENPCAEITLTKEDTLQKGDLIIGSINKTTGVLSFSANPKVQPNFLVASAEAERLAKTNQEKKFVVAEIKGIVSVNTVAWE